MKTAVSIPEDIFADAERLARKLQTSRSRLYARAVSEFVARHAPDRVTETMDRVVDEVGPAVDPLVDSTARTVLEQVEW